MMLFYIAIAAGFIYAIRLLLPAKIQNWLSPLKCALFALVLLALLLEDSSLVISGIVPISLLVFGILHLLKKFWHIHIPVLPWASFVILCFSLAALGSGFVYLSYQFAAAQPHTGLYYAEAVSESLVPLPAWQVLSYSAYFRCDVLRPLIFAVLTTVTLVILTFDFMRSHCSYVKRFAASIILGMYCIVAALAPFIDGGYLLLQENRDAAISSTGVLENVQLDMSTVHNYHSLYGNDMGHIVTISGEPYRTLWDVSGYESGYLVEFTYLPKSRILLYIGGPDELSAEEE